MLNEKSKPGRKPVQDKKIGITIYLKPSEIMKLGGKATLRDTLITYTEKLSRK